MTLAFLCDRVDDMFCLRSEHLCAAVPSRTLRLLYLVPAGRAVTVLEE